MTRDEAVARIQRQLGQRNDKATDIIDELKNAQTFYERWTRLPWFLVDEMHRIQTGDGEERIPVPDDFLREYEKGTLWYWNDTTTDSAEVWTNLAKEDIDYLRETLPGEGAPEAYTIGGDYFRIFPTPDAQYWIKMIYYKEDLPLDDNIENDWLKWQPDLLTGYAGRMIANSLYNDRARGYFTEMEVAARDLMVKHSEAREHENRRYIMGGPD
jgi:hypothetical protein